MVIVLPLVMLVCALSASNSFLYFKWVGSESQIAVLKADIQLIQQKLEQQLLLIETLKTTVQPSVGHAVKHSASLEFTHLLGLVGVVSIVVVLFLLFPNNRSGDPVIDLAREMTSKHETISRGFVEQSLLESKLMTDHFQNLMEGIGAQTEILARLMEDQNVIAQKIVEGNTCIFDTILKSQLEQGVSIGNIYLKLDLIEGFLRQTNHGHRQADLDVLFNNLDLLVCPAAISTSTLL